MKFGHFFSEVCDELRSRWNWVAPETIVTQKTECLDVMYQEYNLAMTDIQNASELVARQAECFFDQAECFFDQAVRSRINTAAYQIRQELRKQLKTNNGR